MDKLCHWQKLLWPLTCLFPKGNDRAAVGAVVKKVVKTSMGGGPGQCCLEKLSSSL